MADHPPNRSLPLSREAALELLAIGEVEIQGLLPRSSNYTFLIVVRTGELQVLAVYKPSSGERPLWDFPAGTLAHREVAAHTVSEALGWMLVPPTVFRDGPKGPGMVQLYVQADPREHYFSMGERFRAQFKRIALFDVLINNADRKSGHCLCDEEGHIWAIDHGVCFHEEQKLRTVIWEFAGSKIPAVLMRDLRAFRSHLNSDYSSVTKSLGDLLTDPEVDALRRRADQLVARGRFPVPNEHRRYVPWPPV